MIPTSSGSFYLRTGLYPLSLKIILRSIVRILGKREWEGNMRAWGDQSCVSGFFDAEFGENSEQSPKFGANSEQKKW